MKKLATIILTLMVFFTSCKPEEENNGPINDNNTNRIKVSCTIPINDGKRSDFTNLFEDGIIRWSDGRECVYLAIPGDEPKIVELEGYCDGYKPEIEFIAYIDENTLTAGESYDIWYFGHSQQLENPYVSIVNGNKIEGSIAKQTGRLEDLGYSHIASTSVTAVLENGEVKLPLVGTLKNRMAIALLDLEGITDDLKGTAINTNYTLEYNGGTGKYEFNVIESPDAGIEIENGISGISYIALLPNDNNKVVVEHRTLANYEYTFYNGIKENKIYHRIDENDNMTTLKWNMISINTINGCEYVDLGLPSGYKWAKYNYGLSKTEPQGNTDNYTAAEFKNTWGAPWERPTESLFQELNDNCSWEWTNQYGIDGYKITGPNGNYIFMPTGDYTTSTVEKYFGSVNYYSRQYYFRVNSTEHIVYTSNVKMYDANTIIDPYIVGYSYRPVVKP